jgi:hypothetical protein
MRIYTRGFGLVLIIALMIATQAMAADLKATVIDRMGNRHEVKKMRYQVQNELEYYVNDQLYRIDLKKLNRLKFEGERGDEEQPVTIWKRDGNKVKARVLTGGDGIAPHQDSFGGGGGQSSFRLSGGTELGPFFILLSDVAEIYIHHPEGEILVKEEVLKATIIDMEGKRFVVKSIRYREAERFDINIGRKQRSIRMNKIDRIEFTETEGVSVELRPVRLVFWSGKVLQGTVDASTVRLSGETDRQYHNRVSAALTGDGKSGGRFRIGLHRLKLVQFEDPNKPNKEQ